ncbi:MAG: TetR/AcrR family transcriptional regulator [Pseudomonadota bacterium]
MPSQEERARTTRAQLLDAFQSLLLDKGLEAATTQAVLEQTGLSKGALYHHYRSKSELMEAVYERESHAAIRRAVAAAAGEATPLTRLKASCRAWVSEMRGGDAGRIVLELGPSALGTTRVAEIENCLSLPLFEAAIHEAVAAGETSVAHPKLAAQLINAYMGQVALQTLADRDLASATIGPVIDAILRALETR